MKKIVTLIFLVQAISLTAQTLDDFGRLSIHVSDSYSRNIPYEAAEVLSNRVRQIITNNGISDNGLDPRFEISSRVDILSKDIIAGSPTRISQKLEISFSVNDVIDKKSYGSTSIITTGIGLNETKAYISAFNNVKSNNSKVTEMINRAKEAIIIYYRTTIDKTVQDAYASVNLGNYDKALYELAKIPDVCSDAYAKAQEATFDIYRKKINAEGRDCLKKAQSEWAKSPNANGAIAATEFLGQIDIIANCNDEVKSLLEEMKEKVKDDDRKAWEFKMQQYADNKEREQRDFEFNVRKYEEAEAKEERRHQEDVAREQRDFEFSVHQFDETMGFKRAVVEASKETVLGAVKILK